MESNVKNLISKYLQDVSKLSEDSTYLEITEAIKKSNSFFRKILLERVALDSVSDYKYEIIKKNLDGKFNSSEIKIKIEVSYKYYGIINFLTYAAESGIFITMYFQNKDIFDIEKFNFLSPIELEESVLNEETFTADDSNTAKVMINSRISEFLKNYSK